MYDVSTDASGEQSGLSRGTDGRHQHDVRVADEIDHALKLTVIVAITLARGLGQASLDKAKHIAIQVEDLEARGSTEVLVNELPVRATDGHAQRRRSRRLRTLPGLKRRILPRFRLRRSRADGGRGGGCHATKYIDPA